MEMQKLIVRGRKLTTENGEPFFYLGDTAWQLFHALSREEIESYMRKRAEQGFNVAMAVALAEFGGLTEPNFYGRLPLNSTDGMPDPEKPDEAGEYSYWDHVEFALDCAARHGIYIGLLPTWGDKFKKESGTGPEIFTPENAKIYGKWIASRYGKKPNLIWILGGDRPLEAKHRKIIDAMAAGIREVDPDHLITYHPMGAKDSTDYLADAPYMDFHMAQTGHDVTQCYRSDEVMAKMAAATDKPYLDAEPRYEQHPACFRPNLGYFWQEDDVRQNAYWSVLSGAFGHTYGHHCVWKMNREPSEYFPYTWQDSLYHPGAYQMGYMKKLMLSRDFLTLRPAPQLLCGNYAGMGKIAAAVGEGCGYVYSPLGLPFTVDLSQVHGKKFLRGSWFDPRSGDETVFGIFPISGEMTFVPPSQGKGSDWVLILENVE